MSCKILISDKIEPICPEIFEKAGCEVEQKTNLAPLDLEEMIGGYDGLVVRSATKVTGKIINAGAAGKLKIIGRAGAGLDNIDMEAAKTKRLAVVNTPGLNANAVAELVIAYMVILARKLGPALSSVKDGRWEKKNLTGTEVKGKTIGLIGVGAVGRLVAEKCRGLGLKVQAFDPFLSAHEIRAAGAEPVALEDLWATSDFLSLHLPKNSETANLVNLQTLSKFKKTAFLINCARGGLVHEDDLHTALVEGMIAGAASDVFAQEPPGWSPLMALPNFVATPHIGASTEEAQLAVAEKVAQLMVAYLSELAAK